MPRESGASSIPRALSSCAPIHDWIGPRQVAPSIPGSRLGRAMNKVPAARPQGGDMAATALDSTILGDIFTTPEMRRVFSDETRIAFYLEFEAALARVQGRL